MNDDLGQEGHLTRAKSLFEQLKDRSNLAEVNLQLATLFIRQHRIQQADLCLSQALKLASSLKRADLEARVKSSEANRNRVSGNPSMAVELFRQAAKSYENLGDKANQLEEFLNEARVLGYDLHKLQDARTLTLNVQTLAEQSNDWAHQIDSLRLMSEFDQALGDYQACLNALHDALNLSNKHSIPVISAFIQLQISAPLADVGQWEEALNAVTAALPILKQVSDKSDEFVAYSTLLYIYSARESDLQDLDKALGYANEARQLIEDSSSSQSASLSLSVYEIHFLQNNFDEAVKDSKAALSIFDKEGNELGQVNALLSLAEALRSSGDIAEASEALARAEPLVRKIDDFYLTGRFYYGQANLYKREGKFQSSISNYEQVVGFLESSKAKSTGPSKGAVSETYNYIYGELIDAYYLRGQAEKGYESTAASKAFEMAELNKSRTFTTTWGRSLIDALHGKLPSDLQEEEQKIVERNATLQSELNQPGTTTSRPKRQIEAELQELSAEEVSFQAKLRRSYPVYGDARYPRQMTLADLHLRPGELLVEFKMFDPATFVWIVKGSDTGPQVVSFYKVHLKRDWFKERIADIRGAMNRGDLDSFDPKVSEELFNALFPQPAAELLRSASALIFIPDDIFSLLPMEILSPRATRNEFVLIGTPTSYYPSAAGLRLTRSFKTDREWRSSFFGIADPITSQDDARYRAVVDLVTTKAPTNANELPAVPVSSAQHEANREVRFTTRGYSFDRLPETANEVDNIANLFPDPSSSTTVRTGTEATKKALLQTDLSGYRFLHFATHGFLPVEPGEIEPALILSFDGSNQDQMMLKLSEISKLPIEADLVVLSACNTGSGKVTRAEGVSSLGSAFLATGASSVVVSLWSVADKSTSELMQRFYKNLLFGMPKNKALAEARKQLFLEGHTHPFYWAPFVLSGE